MTRTYTTTATTATITDGEHVTTYTPELYGTGRLFVCTCGLASDDGLDYYGHAAS